VQVLSSALSRAVREELVARNVARYVELPGWQRGTIQSWAADEARQFLAAAKPDPLYPAFVLLVFCGLGRGEVLGLRWSDIDFDGGVSSASASRYSASATSCLSVGSRLPLVGEHCLCSIRHARPSSFRPSGKSPTVPPWDRLARNRPHLHDANWPGDRAAQPRPVLPAHLHR
jgi:hypothetical protein